MMQKKVGANDKGSQRNFKTLTGKINREPLIRLPLLLPFSTCRLIRTF